MPQRVSVLPYSSIFDNILEGFAYQLKHFFDGFYGHKITVVEADNDDALYNYANKTNKDKINFPFFGYKWNSTDERAGEWNDWLFRQQGLTMKNDAGEFYQVQLLPTNVLGSVNFLCNDRKDVRLYAQRWRDCAKMRYLDFDIEINGLLFRIRVDCDTSYTFPEFQTGQQDIVDMYNVETSVTVHAYSGSITSIKPITQYNVKIFDINDQTSEPQKTLLWDKQFKASKDGLYEGDNLLITRK